VALPILRIFGMSARAKIAPPIVERVAIHMINVFQADSVRDQSMHVHEISDTAHQDITPICHSPRKPGDMFQIANVNFDQRILNLDEHSIEPK